MEISAGVGSFSLEAAPIISINGKKMLFDEDGAVRYKLPPDNTPGNKTVKIRFEYTDQEGMKRLVEKTLKYVVVE